MPRRVPDALGQDRVLLDAAARTRASIRCRRYTRPAEPPPGSFRLLFGRAPVHTFGRTQSNPLLREAMDENEVWVNADVGARLGCASGDYVRLRNQDGVVSDRVKARVTAAIRPDCVYMVHGFGHTSKGLRSAFGKGASDAQLITRYAVGSADGRHRHERELRDHRTGRREAMARFGMVIDTSSCVGCMDCVVACKTENDVPDGLQPRLDQPAPAGRVADTPARRSARSAATTATIHRASPAARRARATCRIRQGRAGRPRQVHRLQGVPRLVPVRRALHPPGRLRRQVHVLHAPGRRRAWSRPVWRCARRTASLRRSGRPRLRGQPPARLAQASC